MNYYITFDTYLKRWIITNDNIWYLIASYDKEVCENHLKRLYKIGEQLSLF